MFTGVSRSAAATAIADGLVLLDSVAVKKVSQRVATGQLLSVDDSILDEPDELEPDPSVELDIAYSDEHVIVLRKLAGQVVHPGAGNTTGTIIQGLLAKFPEIRDIGQPNRPGVVHRLDKGTSGVFSVARSLVGYDSLTAQLFDRTVSRRYLTLAWGHPKTPRGVIEAPIGRAVRDPTRMVVREDGKAARTSYTVLATWAEPTISLFSCALDTGRTHQIRVHMQAIHHPIVGDVRYGAGRDTLGMERPALHAAELGFEHPESGEWLEFSAPLPSDMRTVITSFGRPETGEVPE
ncbi:MAG: 23S rRNA pseudouridine1911/1915/1917 synthase [Verrucomicrobiales bacterium]|jgi:23S rRNA pseudouridine1911/1915/1917 synthase